jgi:pilus assembly protein CpaB
MARRIIGIVVAVVLAAIGTGTLLLYVQSAEQRALAGEQTVPVFVVREEIPRGTAGKDIGGKVERQLVPTKVQALGSVESLAALEGKVASVDLVPGEQLVVQRFAAPQELSTVNVPDELLQVTVTLEPERALGGVISAGDTVGVFASFSEVERQDGKKGPGAVTHLTLHKVLVSNVQLAAGQTLSTGQEGDDEATAAPAGNVLVTLALDAPSAEKVVFATEHGTVYLANEPESAPETGTTVQTINSIFE